MPKLSISCDYCGKTVLIWSSHKKNHTFCNQDCRNLFRVQNANKARDAEKVSPQLPKLPLAFNRNVSKLTENQVEEGKSLLADGNSERFVASYLRVSRHVMKMHCKPGYKEQYNSRYRNPDYISRFTRNKEAEREALRRRRKIIKEVFPDEYKQYVKKRNNYNRDLIRKNLLKNGKGKYIKEIQEGAKI